MDSPTDQKHRLEFIPPQEERYGFIVPKMRSERSAVPPTCGILNDPTMRERHSALAFRI